MTNMNNTNKFFIYLVAAIMGFLLGISFKGCGNNNDTSTHIDTVVMTKTRIDTVFFNTTPTKTKGGTIKKDTSKTNLDFPEINFYTQEYNDSLISGTLQSAVKGELLSTELTYVPKFPKYITRVDSVFTNVYQTTTEIKYKQPFGFIVGGGLGLSHNGYPSAIPQVGIQLKQHINLIYGYDLINQSHNIMVHKIFPLK
jgi:hypothetical protein